MSDFTNHVQKNRFELVIDGHTAYADYRLEGTELFIDYVFAPPELRGTGAAGTLMKELMKEAGTQGWKVTPICGYAASWIRKHRL